MISFVWSAKYPFYAGAGGSETYTAGHIRELKRRGIPARIITLGHPDDDGRAGFPDIPFLALDSKEQLSELDDTLVFVTYPLNVKTKHPAYTILHCPPPDYAHNDPLYDIEAMKTKHLIANSKFSARLWRNYLGMSTKRIPNVYPFAAPNFSRVKRQKAKTDKTRVLYAGRLTPDKGIYTLLAALHMEKLNNTQFELTATTAGSHTDEGRLILKLLKAHPWINVVSARTNADDMAQLMSEHDVVVMPTTAIFWQEMFGMISVEAQHAGCRVVGTRSGGLPETNCGGLLLTEPDNPKAFASGLYKAIQLGSLSQSERQLATSMFTLEKSVNDLLRVIKWPLPQAELPRKEQALFPRLRPKLSSVAARLKG